jgi:hypothetical protein
MRSGRLLAEDSPHSLLHISYPASEGVSPIDIKIALCAGRASGNDA